jgi:hypothetical protein
MFKERSTEKLIEYIQTLPSDEQQLIARRISQAERVPKTKKTAKLKLSSLKGKVSKTSAAKIDKQIKSLRNEWQRDI